MIFLIHHIRKIVLLLNFFLALSIYLYVTTTIASEGLETIRLTQFFAFAAVTNLYLALLASPLFSAFPNLKIKPVYIRARRAIGVSAFFFALLHAYFAFFELLGGFPGLAYLNSRYLTPIIFSTTALFILSLMASTSFDFMVKKLGTRWKLLHRLVYVAAFLIVLHALMLGSHFIDLSTLIPKIFFIALSLLLILEALRLDKYLRLKFPWLPTFGVSLIIVTGLIVFGGNYLKTPIEGTGTSIGIHTAHVKLAQEAQSGNLNSSLPNIPGLKGDRTKRYTADFDYPENIQPGQQTELKFQVYDASNGNIVSLFEKPYAEFFHLIIVDSTLTHFEHIHPAKNGTVFTVSTSFPKAGTYHLYADFQPTGAIDQQIAYTLNVGGVASEKATQAPETNLKKTFGAYEVTMETQGSLSAAKMSVGEQKIAFTITDRQTKNPITDLKPYLNSFGHLVMINQTSYDYLHVHPYDLTPPPPNANGGPKVEFLPIGIYGSFKPGVYRAFGQFSHNGKLFVADFTVKIGN